jgi:predicted  nucleic acid-binding Zn-ribbon protein
VADKETPKVDPITLYCETPGCEFKAKRGDVLKACPNCGGKRFTDNVKKAKIEDAQKKQPDAA